MRRFESEKNKSQLVILLIGLMSLWTSYRLNAITDGWWQSLLQNFGAGLFSSLVLIFLYDRVPEHYEREEKKERNRIAAQKLVPPLRGHIYGVLFNMYRSAVVQKPTKEIETWQQFLTINFPDEVPWLDISFMSPGSYPEITEYPKYISEGFGGFSGSLKNLLGTYGSIMDADLVNSMEEVLNSSLMVLGCALEQTANFRPPNFNEFLEIGYARRLLPGRPPQAPS